MASNNNDIVFRTVFDANGAVQGVEELTTATTEATEKTQSLKSQMRQLREELAKLPEGSQEYTKISAQIGELKDKLDATGESVRTLTGEPLERLNNSFGLIGSSIMNLDFGAATTGLKGMSSAISDFKFKDLVAGAKSFGTTMLDLGKSLLMNPIFLIGGVLVAIIANFEELKKSGGMLGKALTAVGDVVGIVVDKLTMLSDWIGLTDTKAAKLAEENNARIAKEMEDLKSLKGELDKMRKDTSRANMTEREKELADLKEWYNQKLWLARGDAKAQEEVTELSRIKKQQINEKYDKIDADIRKKAEEERRKKEKEEYDRLLENLEFAFGEIEKANKESNKRIAEDGANMTQKHLEELGKQVRASFQASTDEEMREYEKNEKLREGWAELNKQKYAISKQVIEGLTDLNSSMINAGIMDAERGFKVQKALGIASTVIGTIEGAQSAYKTAQASPITAAFPAYPNIMAGIATAAGLARVAAIARQQFNSGATTSMPMGMSSGGGMATPTQSTSAPSVDFSYLGKTNSPQTLQTYILESNVSSAQEANQKIKDQARIK